eukprot:361074-Chlamydomonas_euryale.AAC.6
MVAPTRAAAAAALGAATLTSRLGMSHPIVLAPMAGVTTPEMAAAVSNAGAGNRRAVSMHAGGHAHMQAIMHVYSMHAWMHGCMDAWKNAKGGERIRLTCWQ